MFLHCAAVGAWKLEKEEIREYGNIGWAELAGFACLFFVGGLGAVFEEKECRDLRV